MAESGFPDFVTASVAFVVAPPGTPIAIRQRLNAAVAHALDNGDLKQALAKIGADASPASPEELTSHLAREQDRWARIVEATKLSVE
jgi:tripartite-type tricarboxylate transporter receptor subunit TctC